MRPSQLFLAALAWTGAQLATAAITLAAGGSLTDLGASFGPHISADGQVVAGSSGVSGTSYRWTAAGGLQVLPLFGDYNFGRVRALSADGSVIVGSVKQLSVPSNVQAFKWTASAGMVGLGGTYASGVTADGTTIVGADVSGAGMVRWSEDGTMSPIPGFAVALVTGISADGSVIIGDGSYWTQQDGLVVLPLLPGTQSGYASAISADGSVIVGYNSTPLYPDPNFPQLTYDLLAFRWTIAGGIEPLGHLAEKSPGHSDVLVLCVSGDGSVIGGFDYLANAFVWDEAHGIRRLDNVLASAGIDTQGWLFGTVSGISADGLTLVGDALHNGVETAFLAKVPPSVWVPEPCGSLLVLEIAAVAIGTRRRRG